MALRSGDTVLYEGAVLGTGEMNYAWDSDFYAVVYDVDTDSLRRVTYASTSHGGGYAVDIDATPEVVQRALELRQEDAIWRAISDARTEAARIGRGDTVRVTRTFRSRKAGVTLNPGDTATVFWLGPNNYGPGTRYGLELADGTRLFVPDDAVEQANPPEVDEAAIAEAVKAQGRAIGATTQSFGVMAFPLVYGPPSGRINVSGGADIDPSRAREAVAA
ncbi:MAG: hypothetical protein ACOYOQ_00350 [Microthrixaceae bacterium]